MKLPAIALLFLGLILSCSTGVREIDLISKQFEVSYNVDSTQGMDSSRIAGLLNAKTMYIFTEGGQGLVHTQYGMVSRDSSFRWQLQGDRLMINNQSYAIEKQLKGYKLKSDSAMLILRQQP